MLEDRPFLYQQIMRLQGPILVLGASGFVGSNLMLALLACRDDVFGTASCPAAWRLTTVPQDHIHASDLLVDANLDRLLQSTKPRTIFNCIAYGAYSFERQSDRIHETNYLLTAKLLGRLVAMDIAAYIHAGSSSEYGDNSAGPTESSALKVNSHYSASKASAGILINYYGSKHKFPCANLRLYSVYGPLEDASRLIPAVVREGTRGCLPSFVNPQISRDFVYITDVVAAFILGALNLRCEDYGCSFNIGTGIKTTMSDVAAAATSLFGLSTTAKFTMPDRDWDNEEWYSDSSLAESRLHWRATTSFNHGLALMADWYRSLSNPETYERASKQFGLDYKFSVSAIVACYNDGQAIPIMVKRLTNTFTSLNIDYEIIIVNDNSPDDTENVIKELSKSDSHIVGINHSRNFGSQSAFRSGMDIASKNACVLLDGDLQDPPELIEQFVMRWREGYDVVYGRRVKREAPWHMQIAYKLFYKLFDRFSYISIPHDAGDFSLMDRKVVNTLLKCEERDLFLRGIRAFVGFKQIGVDYIRPERMFGKSTNNLGRNIGWAKKGILSFSYAPLSMLSYTGTLMFVAASVGAICQVISKVVHPSSAPHGITLLIVAILFFGAVNLLAIGIVGEYVGKIFEEVKQRPHYIRRSIIKDGRSCGLDD